MSLTIRAAIAAAFLALPGSLVAQPSQVAVTEGPTQPLTITTVKGRAIRFQVEVAATAAEQEQGLMYRRQMAPLHGMIFPMTPPQPASFWMKNTYLPLDLVFIGPDKRIIRISPGKALSLDLILCPEPVAAVLELNAGTSRRLGIKRGDKVRW